MYNSKQQTATDDLLRTQNSERPSPSSMEQRGKGDVGAGRRSSCFTAHIAAHRDQTELNCVAESKSRRAPCAHTREGQGQRTQIDRESREKRRARARRRRNLLSLLNQPAGSKISKDPDLLKLKMLDERIRFLYRSPRLIHSRPLHHESAIKGATIFRERRIREEEKGEWSKLLDICDVSRSPLRRCAVRGLVRWKKQGSIQQNNPLCTEWKLQAAVVCHTQSKL